MTIHEEIKRRRLALGWSQDRLAEEVSKREGLKKPLGGQTVQQWENGGSAPKRTRLAFVAAALGCTPEELAFPVMTGSPEEPAAVEIRRPISSLSRDHWNDLYDTLTAPGLQTATGLMAAAGLLPGITVEVLWTEKPEANQDLPKAADPTGDRARRRTVDQAGKVEQTKRGKPGRKGAA